MRRPDPNGHTYEVIDLPIRELGIEQIERFMIEFGSSSQNNRRREGPHESATGAAKAGDPERRVKTLASIRSMLLKPNAMELPLLEYVQQRLKQSKRWMWDALRWSEKDGFGNHPSRDFLLLPEAAGVYKTR